MDNPFLVRMLHRLTNIEKQAETLLDGKATFVAVLGDGNAPHQHHDEERPPTTGFARV